MRRIDLNCDIGESPERIRDGTDRHLLAAITSANVACGGHAGDANTMEAIVREALPRGVAIGAHPSYADRAGFGRTRVALPPREIEALVERQVRALHDLVRRLGGELTHVKPHGALYHAAGEDASVAEAIARGAARVQSGLVFVGAASSGALAVWRAMGFESAGEAFADRAYEADGSLRSRSLPGALLTGADAACAQALGIVRDGTVTASDGSVLPVNAVTLCIHGDTPGADLLARAVRAALEAAGFSVEPLSRR